MEFPDLGKHCTVETCKQLDFLPVKCDACQKVFCKDHFSYTNHSCTESYKKDNQVPVCPLCNTPIPVKKGEPPDIKVGYHIDNECTSDPAVKRRKASKNRCTADGCRKKELIPFTCSRCRKHFCIKHRLEEDHKCQGFEGSGRPITNAGASALARLQSGANSIFKAPPSTSKSHQNAQTRQSTLTAMGRDLDRERMARQGRTSATQVQGSLSEDEAMAQAIAASLQTSDEPSKPSRDNVLTSQEEEDLALARALQMSEEEARRRSQGTQRQSSFSKDKCMVS